MRTALTIAGSDSGGGAGIQADLKTFAAHGVFGLTALTAVTAQNTRGVTAWEPIAPDLVAAQIDAVAADLGVHAVKTGMMATPSIVTAVARAIDRNRLPLVVADPVMVAKGGARLLDDEAVANIRQELLPRAHVVTPNVPEAAALAGIEIRSVADMRKAAARILALGPRVVVVKGGHLDGEEAIDVVIGEGLSFDVARPRVATRHTHGTGCTFAAAIAANLALGLEIRPAIERARDYLDGAIRHAPGLGGGHGPLNHFWRTVY
jgi:hydroxymethylpyrimidine/phosphomethylpyrimidine kinase